MGILSSIETINPDSSLQDELIRAKARIQVSFPFLVYPLVSCRFYFVKSDSEKIQTAGASVSGGKNTIFLNERSFIEDFDTPEKRAFMIAHEVMHIIFEHSDRAYRMNYNPLIWNYATDYYINSRLASISSGAEGGTSNLEVPDFGLFDEKYLEYSSADEIYHELLEKFDNNIQKCLSGLGEDGCEDDGKSGVSSKSDDDGQRPFDVIEKAEQDEQHKTENRELLAAGVNQSSKNKKIGTGVGNLIAELESTFEKKVPWQTYLQDFIEKGARSRRTYNHPNRRSSKVVFPSKTGQTLRLVFGFDSSGSMTQEDYNEVASELMSVLGQFDEFEVNLVSCDTEMHDLGTWSSEEGDDLEDVEITAKGGGGTELSPMVEHASGNEEMEKVNCCLIVTDGFIPEEDMERACADSEVPVLILVTSEGNGDLSLNNAMVVHIKDF